MKTIEKKKDTQLYMFEKGKLRFIIEADNLTNAMGLATTILHDDAIGNKKIKLIEVLKHDEIEDIKKAPY